jgi:uncharacterized protein
MKVLITGATGFVGKVIVRQLLEAGDEVVVLTRNIAKAAITLGSQCKYVQWADTNTIPPLEAFDGVHGVINLMGESIAQRWSEEHKKRIYNSRIDGTARLVEAIAQKKTPALVSASAIGIYGNRGSEEITEESTLGDDFLAHVCKDWEKEALKAEASGCRVGLMRTGIVLGRKGGALAKMLPVFKIGLGGPVGSGEQFMSWIHIEDLAAMYIEVLKNDSLKGPHNGTAPYPATNKEFTKALGKVLKRPTFAPAPSLAMKLAFGEMASIILEGQKVIPTKFKSENFRYRYPTLEMALKETAY